jgi:hypothetical protein
MRQALHLIKVAPMHIVSILTGRLSAAPTLPIFIASGSNFPSSEPPPHPQQRNVVVYVYFSSSFTTTIANFLSGGSSSVYTTLAPLSAIALETYAYDARLCTPFDVQREWMSSLLMMRQRVVSSI